VVLSVERITSRWQTRNWRGGIAGADRTHAAHWFVGSCVTGRGIGDAPLPGHRRAVMRELNPDAVCHLPPPVCCGPWMP
jgi:hypothetical protein